MKSLFRKVLNKTLSTVLAISIIFTYLPYITPGAAATDVSGQTMADGADQTINDDPLSASSAPQKAQEGQLYRMLQQDTSDTLERSQSGQGGVSDADDTEIAVRMFAAEKLYRLFNNQEADSSFQYLLYQTLLNKALNLENFRSQAKSLITLLNQKGDQTGLLTTDECSIINLFFDLNPQVLQIAESPQKNLFVRISEFAGMNELGLSDSEIQEEILDGTISEKIKLKKEQLEQDIIRPDRPGQQEEQAKNSASISSTSDGAFSDIIEDNNVLSAPIKVRDDTSEQVSLATGDLEYTVTDFVLPGRNGLDIEIKRRYKTADANYHMPGGLIRILQTNGSYAGCLEICYVNSYYSKNPDGSIGEELYDYGDTGEYHWPTGQISFNDDGCYQIMSNTGLYNYPNDPNVYQCRIYSAYLVPLSRNSSYKSYASNTYINPKVGWKSGVRLGTGWEFCFSHIDDNGSNEKTLVLADGREFPLKKTALVFPSGNGPIYTLEPHTLEDFKLVQESGGYSVDSSSSLYSLYYKDGKVEYFYGNGELMATVDRYGNAIEYRYQTVNNRRECTISDSLGRQVRITNTATENGYNTVVSYDGQNVATYSNIRNAARSAEMSIYSEDESFPGEYDCFNLASATDQMNNTTQYVYEDLACPFHFNARKLKYSNIANPGSTLDGAKNNYYALLKEIQYPTGLKSKYAYAQKLENWLEYGGMYSPLIAERYEEISGAKYNDKEYKYSMLDFDDNGNYIYYDPPVNTGRLAFCDFPYGNPNYKTEVAWEYETGAYKVFEIDANKGLKKEYGFRNFNRQYNSEKTYVNDVLYEQNSYQWYVFLYTHMLPTQVTTTRYNLSDGSQSYQAIQMYSYNKYGDVVESWTSQAEGDRNNAEYKTTTAYHETYHYPVSKTYKRDANHTVAETYTPTADGKSIAKAEISENGISGSRQEFQYDSYGNVIQTKNYTDLSSGLYIETDYTYQQGAYLQSATVKDVRNADGVLLPDVTASASYDQYGRKISETDQNGNVKEFAYNALGDLTLEKNLCDNSIHSYEYNYPANTILETDERGTQLLHRFDPAGNLSGITDVVSNKALSSYSYDTSFRQIEALNCADSQGARKVIKTYDPLDRVTKIETDAIAGSQLAEEQYQYISASAGLYDIQVKTVKGDSDAPDIVTKTYADKHGRIVQTGRMLNGTEYFDTYIYDYLGNKTSEKLAYASPQDPFTTSWEYDSGGRVVKETNALGQFTTNAYDGAGRKIASTDRAGKATNYTYDSLSRLIQTRTPFAQSGSAVIYSVKQLYYDPQGNITLEKISNSAPDAPVTFKQTGYEYNGRGFLTKVITYDGATPANYTQYYHDTSGNILRMYTGLSLPLTIQGLDNVYGNDTDYSVTKYTYDRFGNQLTMTDPLGQTETSAYDLNGNVTGRTDRNGNVTTYTYDGLGRLLNSEVSTPDGQGDAYVTIAYTLTGQKRSENNGTVDTTYTYDALGRMTQEASFIDVKSYTYDIGNNRTGFTLTVDGAQQMNTTYSYDVLNRLTGMTEGTTTAAYGYDTNGNRSYVQYNNGLREEYSYNLANLLTTLVNKNSGGAVLSQYDYTYTLDGNQVSKTEPNGKVTTYTYDGPGRLTNETETLSGTLSQALSYAYDDSNNRSALTTTGNNAYTTTYSYDKNNRLLQEIKTSPASVDTTAYFYDPNGNRISKKNESLSDGTGDEAVSLTEGIAGGELSRYNGFNQMVETNVDGINVTYAYAPSGLRVSKKVDGVRTTFALDGDRVVLELSGSTVTGKYIRGINLVSSTINGNTNYYLYNGHGDVVQLTNAEGTVTKNYDYDAFGNEKNSDVSDTNPFRYSGEYFDKETGRIYLRARYYDPAICRMHSEDSHWNVNNMIYGDEQADIDDEIQIPDINAIQQSSNLYVFAINNPILYVDPNGEAAWITGVAANAAFIIRVDVQVLYVQDDKGNKGIMVVGGGGGGTPNLGAGWTGAYIKDAKTINDLEGMTITTGGSIGWVGTDANISENGDVNASVSAAKGWAPVEGHGVITFGKILFSWR